MYGHIHQVIRSLIVEKFGEEKWKEISIKSGCDEIGDFMTFHHYDDGLTVKFISTVAEVLDAPLDFVLEEFGEYFFMYCLQHGYDKMLRTLGDNIRTFIQNLDSLHSLLAISLTYPDIVAPSFRCEEENSDLILHYYSYRTGLYPIVSGVLKAVGRHLYQQEIEAEPLEITEEPIGEHGKMAHVIFRIKIKDTNSVPSNAVDNIRKESFDEEFSFDESIDEDDRIVIEPKTFRSVFPFHVLFDENLIIKQCGANIEKWSTFSDGRNGCRLDDLFVLINPRMNLSYENIQQFYNATYILEAKMPEYTGKNPTRAILERQVRLTIKGQMIRLNKSRVLFIGSPRLASLNDMQERQLYLSDIPLYDVTRELVLLNQQRIAELNVSKQLDETTVELKRIGLALEKEKEKTEYLLYQMLPKKVANQLKNGISVDAEKFAEVTILFSDIVTFTNIAAAVQPLQIVDMLNDMYMRFDTLTEKHGVYKVETIGDAYMVVGGVPEVSTVHAESVADFSIDMVVAAAQVKSPATGKPLQIRVGLHSGPVVAGVVGQKMPRYCLFGDTVNTASRMESHGVPGKIHLSPTTVKKLSGQGFDMEVRGEIEVKGKGLMTTNFLIGRTGSQPVKSNPDETSQSDGTSNPNEQSNPNLNETSNPNPNGTSNSNETTKLNGTSQPRENSEPSRTCCLS